MDDGVALGAALEALPNRPSMMSSISFTLTMSPLLRAMRVPTLVGGPRGLRLYVRHRLGLDVQRVEAGLGGVMDLEDRTARRCLHACQGL